MKICPKCGNEIDGQLCVFCGFQAAEYSLLFSPEHVQLAEKEKRCFICGTFAGTVISRHNKVLLVELHPTKWGFQVCTLCREFAEENENSLIRVVWNVLEKRIRDSVVRVKICRQCSAKIRTTLSKKEFCSDSCRGKFHREKGKDDI